MATISFKEELVVKNRNKAEEIVAKMQQPKTAEVKPASPPRLPEQAGTLWFKRSEKS